MIRKRSALWVRRKEGGGRGKAVLEETRQALRQVDMSPERACLCGNLHNSSGTPVSGMVGTPSHPGRPPKHRGQR